MVTQVSISYINDSQGGFSRNMYPLKPSVGGIGDFTTAHLQAGYDVLEMFRERFEEKKKVFENRTWHMHAATAPFDPRKVETGLKLFDDQANKCGGLMTGNVCSDVQTSNFIRPSSQLECNGYRFAYGELRKSDLKVIIGGSPRQPGVQRFLDVVNSPENIDKALVGYKVFHTPGARSSTHQPEKHVHGWVVTETLGRHVATIDNGTPTSMRVLEPAVAWFSSETVGDPKPLFQFNNGQLTFVATELEMFYSLKQEGVLQAIPAAQTAPVSRTVSARRPRP